ncbi:MAG: regulatory iron-sulfur-containing complex subunit RicT [Candidatus Zixiibacteriota bacterium]
MADIYLVEFKGSRKEYFSNPDCLSIRPNHYVIVQAERGEGMGKVTKKVPAQMAKSEKKPQRILRLATPEDVDRLRSNREKERECLKECERMVSERNLQMKLVDTELQFDKNKITFYFTAEKRVDFRELVKELASTYKTRIELRQIGVRDEARRIGGFGVCGLPLCCASFIREFEPISTHLAREQNLSLNPAKISGNCGRLLCCLRYEKKLYEESLPLYPKLGEKFTTEKGEGVVEKLNIFKEYVVVKHETGEGEKITLTQLRKKERERLKRISQTTKRGGSSS